MVYSHKEYKTVFDTPMKRQQELAVARKIMDLLNKNKYDDLEKFIDKNKTYQDFLKNNNMQTVIKHFGNTLKEEDYVKILENLRLLTKTKKDFEKENIKTTNIGNDQFNSLQTEDKTYFIDNSNTDETIENQMEHLQQTQNDFQTSDKKQNTERMFQDLDQRKTTIDATSLNGINYESLNEEERAVYDAAKNYQNTIDGTIKLDLDKKVIINGIDSIAKVEEVNGTFAVRDENDVIDHQTPTQQPKTFQKSLTPSRNTIYSN